MPTINLLRHNDFCSTTNTNISLSQAINFSNSADCNFVQLFGFWRRSPIWLVIDFFSTSCHSQLLLVVTAKIMFYVEILPFTQKVLNGKIEKRFPFKTGYFVVNMKFTCQCRVSIFSTLEVRGWISFLSSGNFELQVFLLREGVNWKKNVFFRALPEFWGGGVYPCPNFLALFLEVHFWSIKRVYFFKNGNVLNF